VDVRRVGLSPTAVKMAAQGSANLGVLPQRVLLGGTLALGDAAEEVQAAAYSLAARMYPSAAVPEMQLLLDNAVSALGSGNLPGLVAATLSFLRRLPDDLIGHLAYRKDVFTALLGLQDHSAEQICTMASFVLVELLEQLWRWAQGTRTMSREFVTLAEANLRRTETLDLVVDILKQFLENSILGQDASKAASAATALGFLLKKHMPQARWVLEDSIAHLFPHRGLAGPAFRFRKSMETGDADAEASFGRSGAPNRLLYEKIINLLKQRLDALASRAFTGNCRGQGLLLSLTLAHILSQAQRPSPSVLALAEDWLRERIFRSLSMPGPSSDGFGGVNQVTDSAILLLSTGALSRFRQGIAPILSLSLSGGTKSLNPPIDLESSFGGGLDDEQLRLAGLAIRSLSWIALPFAPPCGDAADPEVDKEAIAKDDRVTELSWLAVASSCLGSALQSSNSLTRVALLTEIFFTASVDTQRGSVLRCLTRMSDGLQASGEILPLTRLLTLPWVVPLMQDALWESEPFRIEIVLSAVAVARRLFKYSTSSFKGRSFGCEFSSDAIPGQDGVNPDALVSSLFGGAALAVVKRTNRLRSLAMGVEVLTICSRCLLWDWPHRATPSEVDASVEGTAESRGSSGALALCWEEYASLLDEVCDFIGSALGAATGDAALPKANVRSLADALSNCIEDIVSWKLSEGVLVPQLRIRICSIISKHLASDIFAEDLRDQMASEVLGRMEMDLFATHAQNYLRRHLKSAGYRGALGGADTKSSNASSLPIYPMLDLRAADALTRGILPGVRYIARISENLRQACVRMLERRLGAGDRAAAAEQSDASIDVDASVASPPTAPAGNGTDTSGASNASDVFSVPASDPFGAASLLNLTFTPDLSAAPTPSVPALGAGAPKAGDVTIPGITGAAAPGSALGIQLLKAPVLVDGMFSRLGIRHSTSSSGNGGEGKQPYLATVTTSQHRSIDRPSLPLHLRAAIQATLSELQQEGGAGNGDLLGAPTPSSFILSSDGAPEAFLWMDPLSPYGPLRLLGAIEDVLDAHLNIPLSGAAEAAAMPAKLTSFFPLDPKRLSALLNMYRVVPSADAVVPKGMLQNAFPTSKELEMDDAGALLRFTESSPKVLNGGSDPVVIQVSHAFGREPEASLFTIQVRVINVSNTKLENIRVQVTGGRGLNLQQDIGTAGAMALNAVSGSSLPLWASAAEGKAGPAAYGSSTGGRGRDSLVSSKRLTRTVPPAFSGARESGPEPCSPCVLAFRSQPLPSGAHWDIVCHARLLSDQDALDSEAAFKYCEQNWIDVSVEFAGADCDPEDAEESGETLDMYLLGEPELVSPESAPRSSAYDAEDAAAFPDLPGQNGGNEQAEGSMYTAVVRGERYGIPIEHTILPPPGAMRRWVVFQDLWNTFFFSYRGVQKGADPRTFQLKAVNGQRSIGTDLGGSALEANLSKLASSLVFGTGMPADAVAHLFECRRQEQQVDQSLVSESRARALLFSFPNGCTVALYARHVRAPGPSTSVSDSVWRIEFRSNRPLRFCG